MFEIYENEDELERLRVRNAEYKFKIEMLELMISTKDNNMKEITRQLEIAGKAVMDLKEALEERIILKGIAVTDGNSNPETEKNPVVEKPRPCPDDERSMKGKGKGVFLQERISYLRRQGNSYSEIWKILSCQTPE